MSNNGNESILHHNLIVLPEGKKASDTVSERHDIVLLFDATKSNPNGDPDAGNMPRLQPDSLKGLVTDVCLKRKIRNFFSLYNPDGSCRGDDASLSGYDIFIRENAVLQKIMESSDVESVAKEIFVNKLGQKIESWDAKPKKRIPKRKDEQAAQGEEIVEASPADEKKKQAYRDALCRIHFDLRAFGGVTSTEGPLKGSFYGQIRGPIQFSFAESLDRVLQLDATITRCAVASKKEAEQARAKSQSEEAEETGNRTMGRKHLIDYGLYRAHIYFSAAFAAKTRFTYYDLDNFLFALKYIFNDDTAAGRTGMRVVGLIDFQHVSCLGNEHSHKLFEKVVVKRTPESETKVFPTDLTDYHGTGPNGLILGHEDSPMVTANRIVWDIAEKPTGQIAAV